MINMSSVAARELAEESNINPQMKWNWRKYKRVIRKRGIRLPVGGYALGCRGHPGIITEVNFWPGWPLQYLFGADVTIKSLVDGIEESCSIFSCAPMAISKEDAEKRAEEIRTMHSFDISVLYGYPVEQMKEWLKGWIADGALYYVLHDQEGQVVRSARALTKEEAEKDIARTQKGIEEGWYEGRITNPHMVDMLTYPAPIKSFELP